MRYYELKNDTENYSSWVQNTKKNKDSFINLYGFWWEHIDMSKYKPLVFDLYRSDTNVKNYQMDISFSYTTPVIFSDKAISVFKTILEQAGQILPIITPSKRKQFFGFIPSKLRYTDNIINFKESEWHQAEFAKSFDKIILNQNAPIDQPLFAFDCDSMIIVNDDFKQLVEDNDLKAFDFSREIKMIPEDLSKRKEIAIIKQQEFEIWKKQYEEEEERLSKIKRSA